MTGHWTEDDFIARLYGVGPPEAHLDECGACRAAWREYQARREFVRAGLEPEIPAGMLMAQRRTVLGRMEQPRTGVSRVVPILAATGILAMGLILVRPSALPPRVPERVTVVENPAADEKFFQEVAAIAQSAEPRAAKPIEALFEE